MIDSFNPIRVAGQLRQIKRSDRIFKHIDEESDNIEEAEAFNKIAREMQPMAAVQQGKSIISKLQIEIEGAQLDGGRFIIALFLSIFKDVVDVLTLGTLGTILNFVIIIFLFIVLLGKGSGIKREATRRARKKIIIRFLAAGLAEFIPLLNMLPFYTITTILVKISADNKVSNLRSHLKEVEKKSKYLKGIL